jgi:hypothetical protein
MFSELPSPRSKQHPKPFAPFELSESAARLKNSDATVKSIGTPLPGSRTSNSRMEMFAEKSLPIEADHYILPRELYR